MEYIEVICPKAHSTTALFINSTVAEFISTTITFCYHVNTLKINHSSTWSAFISNINRPLNYSRHNSKEYYDTLNHDKVLEEKTIYYR